MDQVPFWDSRVVMQMIKVAIIVIVQILIAFLRSPLSARLFKNLNGTQKLAMISGLTLILGIPTFKSIGLDVGDSIFQSLEAIALSVFGHQLKENIKEDVKV